jgi:peptide/nickel transport system substrate-binding protein
LEPFRFGVAKRVPGQHVVFEKNPDYIPRASGEPSIIAGPKIVHLDSVV